MCALAVPVPRGTTAHRCPEEGPDPIDITGLESAGGAVSSDIRGRVSTGRRAKKKTPRRKSVWQRADGSPAQKTPDVVVQFSINFVGLEAFSFPSRRPVSHA